MKLMCVDQEEEHFLQFVKNPTACDYQKTVEFNIFIVPSVVLSNNYNEKSKTDKDHSLLREYYREQLYNKI